MPRLRLCSRAPPVTLDIPVPWLNTDVKADLPTSDVISLDATIVADSEQISCDLADEAVILSLKDGVYY